MNYQISGEYTYSLVNSGGAISEDGFGVLFAHDDSSSGPVEMDGRLGEQGNQYGCLYDHICKILGFDYAFDVFSSPDPALLSGATFFKFDMMRCPSNTSDRGMSPTFQLKKLRNMGGASPVNILLVCGPIKPVIDGATCPISVVGKFLKRVCMRDFRKVVLQCHGSKTVYTYAPYAEDFEPEPISYITSICENDPFFYQSCGMITDLTTDNLNADNGVICNDFISHSDTSLPIHERHHFRTFSKNDVCDITPEPCQIDEINCQSVNLPKNFCSARSETETELPTGLTMDTSKVCNGLCDHYRCEDEALCNGFLYGVYCKGYDGTLAYVKPSDVCDGHPSYLCGDDAEDEKNCPDPATLSSHDKCKHFLGDNSVFNIILLINTTRCAVLSHFDSLTLGGVKLISPLCNNFIDQTNCSDTSRSAVVCEIGGYLSTVSKYFVCHGQSETPSLCDNGIDQVCLERQIFLTCKLHKHQLCDEIRDCHDGTDEDLSICRSLTVKTCIRAYKHDSALRIPLAWLRDGVEDCLNGVDEEDVWPSCGVGRTKRFVDSDKTFCGEVFLCSHQQTAFVPLQDLCQGIGSCGNEKRMCDKSHLAIPIFDKPLDLQRSEMNIKLLFYCLPGLESLEDLAHKCVNTDVDFLGVKVFGVKVLALVLPDTRINCDHTFGEVYLLLSCSGHCRNSPCPIRNKIEYNSCPGQHANRIFTVADNKFLSFVTESRDGYKNDYFQCDNGFCIRYNQVCNLIDECGDGSDEFNCTNTFACNSTNQLIPIVKKCDGHIDCADFSDECNSQCGREILQNWLLKTLCWSFGLLATSLNFASIARILSQFSSKISAEALENNILILLIHFGDFLVGIYLLQVAVMDSIIFRHNYCDKQISWLSSSHCNLLGVLSTVGYQFSLGSVTVLSLTRAQKIRKGITVSEDVSKRTILSVSIKTLSILTLSFAEALVPLIPRLENFFVNGMTYDPLIKLFIGSPGKPIHQNILQEYYGKVKEKNLKWRVINDLIDDMFSHDYLDNAIGRKKLEFYGNEGVCLFKFFVREDDPQRIYVWLVLSINMIFLGIVSACYIFICGYAKSNSRVLTKEKTPMGDKIRERNRRLQRKITLIIVTDLLCWLPVTIVSCLHSANVLDATPYYPLISIVFLPINSVINPLFYNDILTGRIHKFGKKLAKVLIVTAQSCQTQRIHPEGHNCRIQADGPNPHNINPGHKTVEGIELQNMSGNPEQNIMQDR